METDLGFALLLAVDGVRAYWDGESQLWSRVGNPFSAPADFIDSECTVHLSSRPFSVIERLLAEYHEMELRLTELPQGHELDGELFLGRDRFDETSGIVRSMNSPRWTDIRYMVILPLHTLQCCTSFGC